MIVTLGNGRAPSGEYGNESIDKVIILPRQSIPSLSSPTMTRSLNLAANTLVLKVVNGLDILCLHRVMSAMSIRDDAHDTTHLPRRGGQEQPLPRVRRSLIRFVGYGHTDVAQQLRDFGENGIAVFGEHLIPHGIDSPERGNDFVFPIGCASTNCDNVFHEVSV